MASSTVDVSDGESQSETPIPKKRIRLNESSDDDSQEFAPESQKLDSDSSKPSDSPESGGSTEAKIPRNISRWDEKDVQCLSIITSYEKDITPLQLLDMFLPTTERRVLDHVEVFFNQYCYFHNILDGDFASLSREVANELRRKAVYESQTFLDSMYVNKLPVSEVVEVKQWLERFEGCGRRFGKTLFNMALKRDFNALRADRNINPLCEYDFQFLFDAFASIFGLQSDNWCEPFIWPSTLELSKATYTGKADILYCQDIQDITPSACGLEDLMHIVAVVEVHKMQDRNNSNNGHQEYGNRVKQHCSLEQEQIQRITRRSDPCTLSSSCNELPPHISKRLIGQHGGELLLYYPQSAMKKKDVIFGMIIQVTKVTFTALKITSNQYKGIEKGKHEQKTPKLIVTKQYDFLRKEERIHIIRPLIELAMLQQAVS